MYWLHSPREDNSIGTRVLFCLGGVAVVQCDNGEEDLDHDVLFIDTLTNTVLSELGEGLVFVSPNTRYLVIVTDEKDFIVHYLQDDGMRTTPLFLK